MSDEESKQYASVIFKGLGYTVTPISESKKQNEERADLEVVYENETIIVEAKGRDPHKAYLELLKEAKSQGLGDLSRELKSWNTLSSIIEKAKCQLESTPAPETAPRILFISCLHDDWQFVFDSFKYRLYGDVLLALFHKTEAKVIGTRSCFYYDSADFLRYKTIDAVILAHSHGQRLFINEFGERVEYFRKSKLYKQALLLNGVSEPETQRIGDEVLAIIADRKFDNEECRQYILDNYGFRTTVMQRHHFNGIARI